MNFTEGQIHYLNAQILMKHATIVSGAYKSRDIYRGTDCKPENKLSEEELLNFEIKGMEQQIKWLDETIQNLSKNNLDSH
jgi:hypothetical protein